MGVYDTVQTTLGQWGIAGWITVFAIVILFVLGGGYLTYWIIMKRLFYKTIIIFEKIGGQIQVSKRDVARDIKLGEAGDSIMYTKKFKKFLPPAEIQTGHNILWYFVREDGEWINIGIEDIDENMRQAKAHYLDKEMRFARTGMQKNLRERMMKVKFWDKYGAMIMWTLYIVLVGVMTWLLFDKWLDLSGSIESMLNTQGEIMELNRDILQSMDNICVGSGIEPAP